MQDTIIWSKESLEQTAKEQASLEMLLGVREFLNILYAKAGVCMSKTFQFDSSSDISIYSWTLHSKILVYTYLIFRYFN